MTGRELLLSLDANQKVKAFDAIVKHNITTCKELGDYVSKLLVSLIDLNEG